MIPLQSPSNLSAFFHAPFRRLHCTWKCLRQINSRAIQCHRKLNELDLRSMKIDNEKKIMLKALVKISYARCYCYYAIISCNPATERHKIKWNSATIWKWHVGRGNRPKEQSHCSRTAWNHRQLKRQQSNRFLCYVRGRVQLTCNYFIAVISTMKTMNIERKTTGGRTRFSIGRNRDCAFHATTKYQQHV